MMDIRKMCRVCLNVTKNSIMQSALDEFISIKLKICGGITMSDEINEEYPNLICEACLNNLEIAYNFRLACENTRKALKEIKQELESNSHMKFDKLIYNESSPTPLNTDYKSAEINMIDKEVFQNQHANLEYHKNDNFINNIRDVQNDIIIRKYVKKSSISKEDSLGNISGKRKYTKKTPTVNMKLLKKDDKYVCEFCNLEYKGKSSFTYHMRRHTNELNYVCEMCGTAFETNFKLKRHFLKHMGTLPYPCKSCDMKFSSSSNRDRHERRLHTTIRPFQCIYCEKAFSYSDQLKNHIRVHTGEKPYICEKCGSAFKRKSHLSAHFNALTPCVIKMTLKNKVVGEKPEIETVH